MGDQDEIKISAQQHLTQFYQKHGFVSVGDSYLEDGIPHIAMIKKPSKL
jgi:ElaA protein